MTQHPHRERILVRSPNWIGDQILAFPFFYYLRKALPKAEITVVCVPWVESVQFRNLVDHVVCLPQAAMGSEPPEIWDKWRALEDAARMLRAQGTWDLGISLPSSFSSAWLMYRSGVRRRRGYRADGRGFLLNEALSSEGLEFLHRSEEYVSLLPQGVSLTRNAKDFWGIPADNPLDEGIPGEIKEFDAQAAWPDANPIEPPVEPFWVLAPGSMASSRRWPETYFIELVRLIREKSPAVGLIIGGAAESAVARKLIEDPALNLQDWTGRGKATSYWKVLRKSLLTVCNDSGLAHVAALCGSKAHIIWGAGRVQKTQPLGPGKVRLNVNPIDCWPCERNQCEREQGVKLECLLGTLPEMVWKEIQSDFT